MLHKDEHPQAGKTVKIKQSANDIGGQELRLEDWWDRIAGKSWMNCDGNPACIIFAMRALGTPINNEVVYGKIGGLGYLVHTSELEPA